MPTTEAGKALLRDMLDPDEPLFPMDPGATIDAIEAEAREDEFDKGWAKGKAWGEKQQRARIRAAVDGLNPQQDGDIVTLNGTHRRPVTPADYVELYRAAVLRIIDGEDSDDRP